MQTAIKIPEPLKLTCEDYLLLPEDRRYEIIDGELFMTPSPKTMHQRLIVKLFRIIDDFVRKGELGEVFIAPYDVVLSKHDVVQPDIIFVSKERSGIITELNIQGSPDLVIEILSPSTKERDLVLKKKLYAAFGIKEYWIVDPENEKMTLLTLGKIGYEDQPTPVSPLTKGGIKGGCKSLLLKGLKIDIAKLFKKEKG
ncbi:MAG: Uma2 family endonuclease [Nitrospirota bacterium]